MRCLTDHEMRNGLDAEAARELARQGAVVRDEQNVARLIEKGLNVKVEAEQFAALLLANGHPAYVKVDGVDGIVRQMPDGTRHAIEIIDGAPFVVRALPPASATSSNMLIPVRLKQRPIGGCGKFSR